VKKASLAIAALAVSALGSSAAFALSSEDFSVVGQTAVLQGLDKVTARVTELQVPVGGTGTFGSLLVTVRDCRKTPPTEEPESAAFLEIDDDPPDAAATRVFSGWMFASSPGLSALEHPVYDVWLLDCSTASSSSEEGAPAN
jgi:hypothetical protein